MKNIYKIHLFNKNVLVNDFCAQPENSFEALFSLANLLGIKIVEGKDLAHVDLVSFASSQLGQYVPSPFYKGFPKSVRKLTKEQLLFDQLLHYYTTYGLGNFDQPDYSVMEEEFERVAFKEKVVPKQFIIVDEARANIEIVEYVKNLLSSTRPLSKGQYEVVREVIKDFGVKFDECPCKDTAISLLLDETDVYYAKFLRANDFIKIVEQLNFINYDNVYIKRLNLKNKDRIFLKKVLDVLLQGFIDVDDCCERQADWCGILHHLHYKPKTEKAKKFVERMRTGKNTSAYTRFEKAMDDGDVIKAIDILIKEKGSAGFLRKLNYVLSRCTTQEQTAYAVSKMQSDNNVVIIQLMLQYANYRANDKRTFKFPKFNLLRTHTETAEEVAKRRSVICKDTIDTIVNVLKEQLKANLKGKLGKVYIADDMKKIALPLQESASMTGYGNLPKGSRIALPKGKKLRAFTYWEKVNDIDLSVIGVNNDGQQKEFSWRSMYGEQSKAITFSGDETSGFNGGAEYFDLDLDLLKVKFKEFRYFILCNNVYSGVPFNKALCKAGFMMRSKKDSGEIFEPKTVTSSYLIDCDTTFAFLYAIDVETHEIVWLNLGKESRAIIAGNSNLSFLLDYLNATDVINLHSFFTMLATEVVENSEDADVVVCDQPVKTKEGAKVIHSYDTDEILPLLNDK